MSAHWHDHPGLSDVSNLAVAVAFLGRVLSVHEIASCHFDLHSCIRTFRRSGARPPSLRAQATQTMNAGSRECQRSCQCWCRKFFAPARAALTLGCCAQPYRGWLTCVLSAAARRMKLSSMKESIFVLVRSAVTYGSTSKQCQRRWMM